MPAAAKTARRVVLYEGAGSQPLEAAQRQQLLALLLDRGYTVSRVRPDGEVSEHGGDDLVVLGRFDTPVTELANSSFNGQDAGALKLRDISGATPEEAVAMVEEVTQSSGEQPEYWKPWFPVIDYDRCTNCMQCLSFCLFDVYGVTQDGQITVRNETNCKTDCPACSRVCPEVAILFPKYKAGPINGDEISEDDLRREAMKVDISSLLGGDIYSMLRDRNAKAKSRFSKERDDERALKERQRCLKKLSQQMEGLDIPAEALANLPSADEIQFKAAQAKKLADSALAKNRADAPPSE